MFYFYLLEWPDKCVCQRKRIGIFDAVGSVIQKDLVVQGSGEWPKRCVAPHGHNRLLPAGFETSNGENKKVELG